jgi:hypothetical protein
MMVVELLESCVEIHGATKIRILFFYPSTARCSQEEEDRQLEKPHSTPNSFRLSALHITGLDPESTAAVYPWLYNRKENPTHGGTEMS